MYLQIIERNSNIEGVDILNRKPAVWFDSFAVAFPSNENRLSGITRLIFNFSPLPSVSISSIKLSHSLGGILVLIFFCYRCIACSSAKKCRLVSSILQRYRGARCIIPQKMRGISVNYYCILGNCVSRLR